MSVSINNSWDCTQKELVADIAAIIYQTHGARLLSTDQMIERFDSQHPTERAVWSAAESIFELLTGDIPDYAAEEED